MRLSYQAEIRPTPTQRRLLLQNAGCARWAYNWGLRKHQEAYATWVELGKPAKWKGWPNAMSLHKELNLLKKIPLEAGGVPWMYDSSKAAPQEALRNLERALKNWMSGRAKYPRFKSRSRGVGGFSISDTVRTDHRSIYLSRIGKVRFQPGERGYLPSGKHSQVTVTEHAGRWFVSVVGPEVAEPPNNGKPSVGVDLGIAKLATLSDGSSFENPRALATGQRKLRQLQQAVSRKNRGSKNRKKALRRLARAHARVANVRLDSLHKATTTLAKNHGRVVIEDLKARNMTRKGRGKRGLNSVVLDASFGTFRRFLEYKGRRWGCEVVAVPAAYTSQRCSSCGHTKRGNRSSQALFLCLGCGHSENADVNAAKNILVLGTRSEAARSTDSLNACRGDVSLEGGPRASGEQTPMKQEPGLGVRPESDQGIGYHFSSDGADGTIIIAQAIGPGPSRGSDELEEDPG